MTNVLPATSKETILIVQVITNYFSACHGFVYSLLTSVI
uniref:Uncharacterized protein n=1 Tax=Arundo donax TaxID=35708 RepID=A0A0A9BF32_ARUDO